MSLVSLFSDERGFLASDQLVYTAKELHQVQDAATMAAELASAIKDQTQINVAAKSAGLKGCLCNTRNRYSTKDRRSGCTCRLVVC